MQCQQTKKQSAGDGGAKAHPHSFGLMKAAYSVNETIDKTSLGRTMIYELVKLGELRPIKVGHKTLFGADDIASLLARKRAAAQ